MQTIASYLPLSANCRAADGISNDPGTRTMVMSSFDCARLPQRQQRAIEQPLGDERIEPRYHDGEPFALRVQRAFDASRWLVGLRVL